MSERQVWLGKKTRREFREGMQRGDFLLAILPVAAVEQHLEHMAMEHDWRSVSCVAEAVSTKLYPRVLIADALMAGVSEHHMIHPGTLSLQPGTFLTVLSDLIDSLIRGGFRNVLVLNGHGGNIVPCQSNWDQFLRKFQINLHFLSYWDVLTEDDARKWLESGSRLPDDLPGHAQEFETSMGLHLFPENVRQDVWKDQTDQTPSIATAAKGKGLFETIVARVAEVAAEIIEGRRIAEVPPFHP